MKLSVIIACYNAETTLGETLAGLANQTWDRPWEVIVSNNRSTDGSVQVAESFRERLPNLRLVHAAERQGQPFAINYAIQSAIGESVAFVDADDVVGAGWLGAIGQALEQHLFVAARTDTERLNPGWMLRTRGNNQRDGLQPYRYPKFLPHAGGNSIALRRQLFLNLGGFDESLPYLHDTDLCWKAQLRGVSIKFVPEAVVHVRYRDSLAALHKQARNYGEYNVLLYKRYRALGMPSLTWRQATQGWLDVMRRSTTIRDKASLGHWLWFFSWRLGRLTGSIKHRVMAL